ncbi:MAG: hypothetical protein M9955_22290 [Rhizobiaceae bacterium]|nr:hypothetical protein [Rhizobiaceae bacterium]
MAVAGEIREESDEEGTPATSATSVSAKALLFTILGEYVFPEQRPVWTATILEALTALDVSEKAGRQAINRANASGWIEGHREGRRVAWQLTGRIQQSMNEGLERVKSIGQEPQPWDERWMVLYLSLPESHRGVRSKLYKALRWAGFGTPTPGLWINPHSRRVDETRRILERFGISDRAYVFSSHSLKAGQDLETIVRSAWDHDEILAIYDRLLERFGRIDPGTDREMFAAHFALVHEWQQIPFIDPALPKELLFDDRRAQQAARELEALKESSGRQARRYWRNLMLTVESR